MRLFSVTLLVALCCLNIVGCCIKLGRTSNGKLEVYSIPEPESPSKVKGIGDAMKAGKSVLIYRTCWKSGALPDDKRNLFFISKLMNSYSPEVKVIELGTSVRYNSDDYYTKIRDYIPGDGFAVIKRDAGQLKMYKYEIVFNESYEALLEPLRINLETVLGSSTYNKAALIKSKSIYPGYNKAVKERRSMIILNFENTCSRFLAAEKKDITNNILPSFSHEAEIFEVQIKNYVDPANELYSKHRNIVNVYNYHTKKVYPAFYTAQDLRSNIRKFLAER